MQRLELEELLCLHFQTTRRKIEMLGGVLRRLLDELQGRPMENITTDKLLDLILKFNHALTDSISEKIRAELPEEPELNNASII